MIDKRPSGGALWVIGGSELGLLLKKFEGLPFKFSRVEGGSLAVVPHGGLRSRVPSALLTSDVTQQSDRR